MADLVAFIRARLDEDEWHARHAFADHNSAGPNWREATTGVVDTGGPGIDDLIAIGDSPIARHIAHNDPGRVLADVDAKRRIIGTCQYWLHDNEHGVDPCAAETLRLLALPYADHPDYREEWRP